MVFFFLAPEKAVPLFQMHEHGIIVTISPYLHENVQVGPLKSTGCLERKTSIFLEYENLKGQTTFRAGEGTQISGSC